MFYPLLAALSFAPAALADSPVGCRNYALEPNMLVELEEEASIGALTDVQKECLEKSYKAAKEQTVKNKISRVLLVNAYAYDTSYWAGLVQRHLDEVDRSDPDIAYLYSFYIYNRPNNPDFEAVIYWTEIALDRKNIWTGETYVKRVAQLQKVRAMAAAKLWQRHAEGGDKQKAEEARLKTKTYAREWIDFAKSAGITTVQAEALCVSAANEAACGLLGPVEETPAPGAPTTP